MCVAYDNNTFSPWAYGTASIKKQQSDELIIVLKWSMKQTVMVRIRPVPHLTIGAKQTYKPSRWSWIGDRQKATAATGKRFRTKGDEIEANLSVEHTVVYSEGMKSICWHRSYLYSSVLNAHRHYIKISLFSDTWTRVYNRSKRQLQYCEKTGGIITDVPIKGECVALHALIPSCYALLLLWLCSTSVRRSVWTVSEAPRYHNRERLWISGTETGRHECYKYLDPWDNKKLNHPLGSAVIF